MIGSSNLREALTALGFTAAGSVLTKLISECELQVDTKRRVITYPEAHGLVVRNRAICNFSAPENFVVLECVHRLLEKGYKAEHIELEPRWKLGHGTSGGRADILVKDHTGKPILIIECKTPGAEFKKAWAATTYDGGQLFSYAHQINDVPNLCLYTSSFDGSKISYVSHLISHSDNIEYLTKNPNLRSFSQCTSSEDRFAVWKETYNLEYAARGVFETDIQPYVIGKTRYTVDDLSHIARGDQQKKYHEFATILRQHNVSGRENAFDKLINLFLCKIVDETQNSTDLEFYWKGIAYDNHFDLIDRLQRLYQSGMAKFLGEEITYISREHVDRALRLYKYRPDQTRKAVWNLFAKQKFFTNNDFAFIDVHNEALFYQNAEILLKIIGMWQDVRLTSPSGYNQFLGDLFEGFLDQGVKQSEGQFFTPMPICRFLLMSLPLEQMLADNPEPPKALDYACGAGHFLTELALQLSPLVAGGGGEVPVRDYYQSMIGIEKEYRLSKVSKVAAFMHGFQDIQICYGDGLARQHKAFPDIADGTFDLLVANPPYSVRGFLRTVPESDRNAYELTGAITDPDTASCIETFFIERAKQVLKPGGVAAIITPAALLSNADAPYVRVREILLKFFDVIAIVELGSGTFGKTGTNTVTLFLRRKASSPEIADHFRERVEEWFAGCPSGPRKQVVYKDEHLLEQYAAAIDVPVEAYRGFLKREPDVRWTETRHFKAYRSSFEKSALYKQVTKGSKFNAKAEPDRAKIIADAFITFSHAIEKDKLYYFILASDQSQPVLIIRSPHAKAARKKFLGYEWRAAKGDEGIKLIQDSKGRHLTPLYEAPQDGDATFNRRNPDKLNHYIISNFEGSLTDLPDELLEHAKTARLPELLALSEPTFKKAMSLAANATVVFETKWELKRIDEVAQLNPSRGQDPIAPTTDVGFVDMGSVSELGFIDTVSKGKYSDYSKRSLTYFKDNDIILAKITPCMENGKCGLASGLPNGMAFGSTEFHVIRCDAAIARPAFVLSILNRPETRSAAVQNMTGSSGHRRVPEQFYARMRIPVPPLEVQDSIIAGVAPIEDDLRKAYSRIAAAKSLMQDYLSELLAAGHRQVKIDELGEFFQYGLSEALNEAGIGHKIFRMNEIRNMRMTDSGNMKFVDVNDVVFEQYKLRKGDLLFNRTNSIEHVGKVGIFDIDGDYCFASYLVRISCNKTLVLPRYLLALMNSEFFLNEIRQKASKSINQANINPTVMRGMTVPLAPMAGQEAFLVKWNAAWKSIDDQLAIISKASTAKEDVLQRYL